MASAVFEGTSLVNMFVRGCWVNGIRRLIVSRRGDEEEFFEIRTEWSDRSVLYLHRSLADLGRLWQRLRDAFPEDRPELARAPLRQGSGPGAGARGGRDPRPVREAVCEGAEGRGKAGGSPLVRGRGRPWGRDGDTEPLRAQTEGSERGGGWGRSGVAPDAPEAPSAEGGRRVPRPAGKAEEAREAPSVPRDESLSSPRAAAPRPPGPGPDLAWPPLPSPSSRGTAATLTPSPPGRETFERVSDSVQLGSQWRHPCPRSILPGGARLSLVAVTGCPSVRCHAAAVTPQEGAPHHRLRGKARVPCPGPGRIRV